MTWTKLEDTFHQDVRWETAGPLAMALHVAALCHCNQSLSDGRLTRARARILVVGIDDPDTTIAQLIKHGFWSEVDDGYLQVVDWDKTQWTKEQVVARRDASYARLKDWRAKKDAERNAVTNNLSNGTANSVSNALPNPTRPDPTPRSGSGSRSIGAGAPGSAPNGAAQRAAPPAEIEIRPGSNGRGLVVG